MLVLGLADLDSGIWSSSTIRAIMEAAAAVVDGVVGGVLAVPIPDIRCGRDEALASDVSSNAGCNDNSSNSSNSSGNSISGRGIVSSPIFHLHDEILSAIFLWVRDLGGHSLPSSSSTGSAPDNAYVYSSWIAVTTTTHVCRRWRDIAVYYTPELWTTLRLGAFPGQRGFKKEWLAAALARSRSRLLEVHVGEVGGRQDMLEVAVGVLESEHFGRIRRLSMDASNPRVVFRCLTGREARCLEELRVVRNGQAKFCDEGMIMTAGRKPLLGLNAPKLTTLVLEDHRAFFWLNDRVFEGMLKLSHLSLVLPNRGELLAHGWSTSGTLPPIYLPSLCKLHLEGQIWACIDLLKVIAFPGNTKVSISATTTVYESASGAALLCGTRSARMGTIPDIREIGITAKRGHQANEYHVAAWTTSRVHGCESGTDAFPPAHLSIRFRLRKCEDFGSWLVTLREWIRFLAEPVGMSLDVNDQEDIALVLDHLPIQQFSMDKLRPVGKQTIRFVSHVPPTFEVG